MRGQMARETDQDHLPLPARRQTPRAVARDQRHTSDRRQRNRVGTRLPGWLYRDEGVVEVLMQNVEDDRDHILCPAGGAGFVSPVALRPGAKIYLKIGIGPYRHPRAAEVIRCERRDAGDYAVGVSFGGASDPLPESVSVGSSGSTPAESAA